MFFQSPQQPVIITLVPKPSDEMTLGDVLMTAFSLTGALVALGLALGLVMAVVLVQWNRRHRPEENHMPPITN